MKAYYNEFDPYCAEWLRELIFAELIPDGDVDERSIEDVKPHGLDGYTQCHFFAGIGGWPLALRLAGWPDEREVWTGSCPCQPFSAAGKRKGTADERHLWPAFYWLIRQRRPATVFGEQVASKDGRTWLAGVQADLEALGYSAAGTDLCAAGVGAPHIRQRLWWVADRVRLADAGYGRRDGCEERDEHQAGGVEASLRHDADGCGAVRDGGSEAGRRGEVDAGRLGDTDHAGPQRRGILRERADELPAGSAGMGNPWADCLWLPCADGKARRIEPGIEPLAHGVSARVGKLRAFGNAIVPQVAAEVIGSYLDSEWLL